MKRSNRLVSKWNKKLDIWKEFVLKNWILPVILISLCEIKINPSLPKHKEIVINAWYIYLQLISTELHGAVNL
jgi:hypothetical protein